MAKELSESEKRLQEMANAEMAKADSKENIAKEIQEKRQKEEAEFKSKYFGLETNHIRKAISSIRTAFKQHAIDIAPEAIHGQHKNRVLLNPVGITIKLVPLTTVVVFGDMFKKRVIIELTSHNGTERREYEFNPDELTKDSILELFMEYREYLQNK